MQSLVEVRGPLIVQRCKIRNCFLLTSVSECVGQTEVAPEGIALSQNDVVQRREHEPVIILGPGPHIRGERLLFDRSR